MKLMLAGLFLLVLSVSHAGPTDGDQQLSDETAVDLAIPAFPCDADDIYTPIWEFPPDGGLCETLGVGRTLAGHTVIFCHWSHLNIPLRPKALLLVSSVCLSVLVLLFGAVVVVVAQRSNGGNRKDGRKGLSGSRLDECP